MGMGKKVYLARSLALRRAAEEPPPADVALGPLCGLHFFFHPLAGTALAEQPFAMERRPGAGRGGYGTAAYDAHMENENDMQIGELAGKVSALKDISNQINIHIKGDSRARRRV